MLVMHVSPPPNEPPEPAWKGYFYAGILIVTAVVQTLFGVQHNKRMLLVGMRVRTVLSSAVYRKALFVSNAAKKGNREIRFLKFQQIINGSMVF